MVFWQCFCDLDSSRIIGMEASPIQASDVDAWCRLRDLHHSAQLVEDIWSIVHLVDLHRMAQMRADQSKPTTQTSNNANARSRN